jgi:hypothetical protein
MDEGLTHLQLVLMTTLVGVVPLLGGFAEVVGTSLPLISVW